MRLRVDIVVFFYFEVVTFTLIWLEGSFCMLVTAQ